MPRKKKNYNLELFSNGQDLPLFSGQPEEKKLSVFSPEPTQPEPEPVPDNQLSLGYTWYCFYCDTTNPEKCTCTTEEK